MENIKYLGLKYIKYRWIDRGLDVILLILFVVWFVVDYVLKCVFII